MTQAAAPCQVVVTRVRKGYQDRLRRYKIVIDDWPMGDVKYGGAWTGQIVPGRHRVKMVIDWKSSPEIEVNAVAGATIQLECGPGPNIIGGVTQIMSPNDQYLYIREL